MKRFLHDVWSTLRDIIRDRIELALHRKCDACLSRYLTGIGIHVTPVMLPDDYPDDEDDYCDCTCCNCSGCLGR